MPFDAAHAIGNVDPRPDRRPGDGADARPLPRALRVARRRPWSPRRCCWRLALVSVAAGAAPRPPSASRAAGWLVSVAERATAAAAPRPAATRAPRHDRPGRCSASRRPAATRSTSRAAATPRSTTCAPSVDELSSTGDFARTILALEGAGVDPRSFGGRDLVAALAKRRRDNGSFEGWPGSTAFAVIALRAGRRDGGIDQLALLAGQGPERRRRLGRRARLAEHRRRHRRGDAGDARHRAPPSTASATCARRSGRNGGFPLGGSGAVNSQSTAWAVQGMLAVGDRSRLDRRTGGNSALDYLAARQDERRPLPLLGLERPDAGLGDRPGPGRRRRRVLPGAPGRARADAGAAARAPPRGTRLGPRRPAADDRHGPGPDLLESLGQGGSGGVPPAHRRRRPARLEPPGAGGAVPAAPPGDRRRRATKPNRPRPSAAAPPLRSQRQLRPRALGPDRHRPRRRRPRPRQRPPPGPPLQLVAGGLYARGMDVETAIRTRRTHKAFAPGAAAARARSRSCSSWRAGRRTTT